MKTKATATAVAAAPKTKKQATKKTAKAKARAAKPAKQPKASAPEAAAPAPATREASKKDLVLGLLRRPTGATLGEIISATGWQKHTVRGFMAGTVSKKMGIAVESTKNDAGDRTYRIA